ncbi:MULTISPECIES: hypothetical protein [Sphingobacterium]|uniref:Lipoprotein n=1 Tax=Sphingobacterium multivorum TaxID=28454 RepID=A0A2X2JFP1_SPHMU|nr:MULTISPECIES: hypothetical protein [Sphingobacterium]QRQ62314.1 hypothetical protein I6J33_04820 [Sphingobacterium multivorum]SPZ92554.1 Uncharacterised protein [Sphingobacterium multivorum]
MKNSFYIAVCTALIFTSCANNSKSTSDNPSTTESVNQDSIDKAHGHSHDPSGGHTSATPAQDSSTTKVVNQDSIDKAHGHKH